MKKLTAAVAVTMLTAFLSIKSINKDSFLYSFPLPLIDIQKVEEVVKKPVPKIESARIEVNIPSTTLRYFENDSLIMQTPVSVGTNRKFIKYSNKYESFRTPVRNSRITRVEKDPWWTPNPKRAWSWGQKPVPPGPDNPLGTYKMRIDYSPYFIHGTNTPNQLGGAVSHGCIRMHNDSINILAPRIQEVLNSIKVECNITYNITEIYCLLENKSYAVRIFPDYYRNRPNREASVIKNFEDIGIKLTEKDKRTIRANCIWEGIMFFEYKNNELIFINSITNWRILPIINFPKETLVLNGPGGI